MKALAAVAVAVCMFVVVAPLAFVAAGGAGDTAAVSPLAAAQIPPELIAQYQAAAATCPGMSWAVLAGVGFVESRHADGRADPANGHINGTALLGYAPTGPDTDHGVLDGDPRHDWAVGLMQITPSTWRSNAMLGVGHPAGTPPDINNAWDDIATGGHYLCALLALFGSDTTRAVAAYTCGPGGGPGCGLTYAAQVMAKAAEYTDGAAVAGTLVGGNAGTVVAVALAQVGKPYVWGAAGPDAFDCSGLAVYAYTAIGIALPHLTFDQVTMGIAVSLDSIQPGDLIFGPGGDPIEDYGHEAIAIGNGQMVVATHTGASIDVETINPAWVQSVRRIIGPTAAGPASP
jgi:cell wall-associated NlpC family hydrolase